MPTRLWFFKSASPDVVSYELYMVDSGTPLVRGDDGTVPGATVFNLGNPGVDNQNKIWVDMEALPGITDKDGTFDFGVSAIDDAGNPSAFLEIKEVSLDFIPPDAPTAGGIVRS